MVKRKKAELLKHTLCMYYCSAKINLNLMDTCNLNPHKHSTTTIISGGGKAHYCIYKNNVWNLCNLKNTTIRKYLLFTLPLLIYSSRATHVHTHVDSLVYENKMLATLQTPMITNLHLRIQPQITVWLQKYSYAQSHYYIVILWFMQYTSLHIPMPSQFNNNQKQWSSKQKLGICMPTRQAQDNKL